MIKCIVFIDEIFNEVSVLFFKNYIFDKDCKK